ncbi:uncharacterized protein LOC121051349 [Rosa chinensis]|uniref:uncharacterized protein LOC121051349 n=1 Tax=Rosa chinensis TaxID=74649 RepID=UPI001AD8FE07|nr:uncharacterized protein LOC121051349 [Rosa chinensis]
MLYWKEHSEATSCCICSTSRYIKGAAEDGTSAKKIAAKVLRYFPLGPRLQRLYMSRHTAESMIWHSTKRPRDGFLRHPADSPAWSKVDELYPNFGNESRNVRLGLASDGFNPFGNMSTSHSTWPVVMSVYNLPPWMCMKQPYMMLSLLIPGPKGPGNDIDVYLQPLVEELKNLWNEGIHTYDAFTKSTFTMRAAVLWTISDFPAYAMLSGYSTKGYKACPVCMEETDSIRLHHGNKECFMGHRRWLPIEHKYRRWRNSFNGLPEHRGRPTVMSGTDCLRALSGLRFQFGKGKIPAKVRKRSRSSTLQQEPVKGNWRKKSIFFDLPYWEHLLLRHNLDVMHIEKNVTDSVVGTLLGMKWKNKDSAKAHEDMVLLNVKKGLHPISPGGRYPPAIFNLKNMEKTTICKVLHSIHPPDGFCSNISNCVRVEERTLVGLKSHDNHILMQHLLPVAIRRAISCKVLTTVLLELSSFFRQLCTKVGSADYYANLSRQIALALCTLEAIMPPAFFDVMEHLPIHLADEAAIAGPVQYRWMYPIERYLFTLKKYVRNKNLPEGCIAEGYIIEECLSFCVMYLSDGVDSKRTRIGRNADDPNNVPRLGLPVFDKKGRALEKPHEFKLTKEDLLRAHTHVLINCPEIKSYLKEHVEREKSKRGRRSCQDSERLANLSFAAYFKNLIETKVRNGDRGIDPDVRALAAGPNETVGRYKKYVINGFRFHVKSLDTGSNAQNSGIFVNAGSNCYATADDHRPRDGMLDYYGILTDIIELDYHSGRKVLLFDGDWIDNRTANRGIKKDEYGFLLENFNHLLPKPDTLVFASQTLQVFYVKCPVELDWDVIVRTRPRDYFDMGADLSPEPYAHQELHNGDDDGEDMTIPRTDMPDIALD